MCSLILFAAANISIGSPEMHLTALIAILAALLPALVSAEKFTAPPPSEALDVSGPITVAWDKPNKPSDEWRGLVNVTAMFSWLEVGNGRSGTWFYDIAGNRPNDAPGEAKWDPRGVREFLKANGTGYGVALVFTTNYYKIPPSEVTDNHFESRGAMTDEYEIEGYSLPDRSAAVMPRAAVGAVMLGALAHFFSTML